MAGCLKEGAGSLHSGVEVKGPRGVSVQVGGVNQESSWRERFVQPQLDTGAEVAPEGLKGWASELDLDPAESGEPEQAMEQQQLFCEG